MYEISMPMSSNLMTLLIPSYEKKEENIYEKFKYLNN